MDAGVIISYSIKVTIYLTLFFAFNKLLLSRETLHRLNRFLWIAIVILSFVLPAIVYMPSIEPEYFAASSSSAQSIDITAYPEGEIAEQSNLAVVVLYLFYIYMMGVLTVAIYNVVAYSKLIGFIFRARKSSKHKEYAQLFEHCERMMNLDVRVRYIVHDEDLSPFSWMNYVVISEKDLSEEASSIVTHELAHISQRHSWDILLMNLATVAQWYNPAVWLAKIELQQVHEYCADETVILQGVNMKQYQLLLIKKAVGPRFYSMSNNLNHSNLKKRITMMLKKKSNRWQAAKGLYAIPLTVCVAVTLASPLASSALTKVSQAKVTEKSEKKETQGNISVMVIGSPDDSLKNQTYVAATTTQGTEKSTQVIVVEKDSTSMLDAKILYVVDEKVISEDEFKKMDVEMIQSIEVFKQIKPELKAKYSITDQQAVIIITTKKED